MLGVIALLTDFGLDDQYVFQVKSVIRSITDEEIVDITHTVPPFDVRTGAFVLWQAAKYLPAGSTAVAVVDPGVGGGRRCVAIRTKRSLFVGPDNGLMWEAANSHVILEARSIESERLVARRGGTFDGRDVFAPAAAHLVEGYPFEEVGPPARGLVELSLPKPEFSTGGIRATVLHVDRFGNAILNLDGGEFAAWAGGRISFEVKASGSSLRLSLHGSYESIQGTGLVVGSSGLVEVSSPLRGAAGIGGEVLISA